MADFEVVRLESTRAIEVLPARRRHQRFPPDEVVKGVTSMEEYRGTKERDLFMLVPQVFRLLHHC